MDFHKEWKSDEITELYNLFVRELIGLYMIEVIIMIENKTVTRKIADEVFAESIQTWESPESIVKRKGLQIEKDDAGLEIMIKDSIKNNPVIVEKFKAGNDKAINALKGPILKASKGKIDPNKLDELFRKFLA
jgi:aspartyl-tRNA(Asn)/glutamyl-tRNA(Gln) amidotransferase subunit B